MDSYGLRKNKKYYFEDDRKYGKFEVPGGQFTEQKYQKVRNNIRPMKRGSLISRSAR